MLWYRKSLCGSAPVCIKLGHCDLVHNFCGPKIILTYCKSMQCRLLEQPSHHTRCKAACCMHGSFKAAGCVSVYADNWSAGYEWIPADWTCNNLTTQYWYKCMAWFSIFICTIGHSVLIIKLYVSSALQPLVYFECPLTANGIHKRTTCSENIYVWSDIFIRIQAS